MDDEQRLEFRDALTRFVRTYSFVSQIAAFTDPALERDYVYCRALSLYLRDTGTVERLDLGTEVELTHLRHQMTFSGTLSLTSEVGEVRSFFGEGKGGQQELDLEHLSSIVEVLNERFGTDLTDVDKLLFDQFEETWVADDELSDQAQNNTHRELPAWSSTASSSRRSSRAWTPTSEIFKRILDDEDFRDDLGFYLRKVYERLRESGLSPVGTLRPSVDAALRLGLEETKVLAGDCRADYKPIILTRRSAVWCPRLATRRLSGASKERHPYWNSTAVI